MNLNKQTQADFMLLLVTLCWGVSYYLMDLSLADMDPFTLNAHRFLGAFLIAAVLSWKKIKTVNKVTLKYSVLVGIALVFVYIGATFGVKYTSLANSGFLCALTVVFTPIIGWIFLKQRPSRKLVLVVAVCLAGIALLTLKDDFSINLKNLKGDLLCIMCAMAYAVDLLLTEKAVAHEEVDAYQLGVFQLGVTGVCNLILAFLTEIPHFPTTGPVLCVVPFCFLHWYSFCSPADRTAVYDGIAYGCYFRIGTCLRRSCSCSICRRIPLRKILFWGIFNGSKSLYHGN